MAYIHERFFDAKKGELRDLGLAEGGPMDTFWAAAMVLLYPWFPYRLHTIWSFSVILARSVMNSYTPFMPVPSETYPGRHLCWTSSPLPCLVALTSGYYPPLPFLRSGPGHFQKQSMVRGSPSWCPLLTWPTTLSHKMGHFASHRTAIGEPSSEL